jgi:ketosteroid isomerase-like protein
MRTPIRSINQAFGDVRIEVKEMRDVGDQVVVLANYIARGRSSGVQRESEDGYVWTVRHGLAVSFQWFNDPVKALEAVGLRE